MKMNRRHLIGSLILLTASIVWNVWAYSKPRPAAQVGGGDQIAGATTDAQPGIAVDPASIPSPPAVDLTAPPQWTRSPFMRTDAPARVEAAPAPAAAPPADPVVGTIMFSPGRRGAIVDGRIVGVGDRVGAGVIVDIARDAVVVRLSTGEERRLPLLMPRGSK